MRGYDNHFIMQQIGEFSKKHKYINKNGKEQQLNINCIPNNMEKYMAFMLGKQLTCLNIFQFMSQSLEKLASNLRDEGFKYTSETFQNEKLKLMKQKGVYSYDFMDSFQKFNQTELPKQEEFYNIRNVMCIYLIKTINMLNVFGKHLI